MSITLMRRHPVRLALAFSTLLIAIVIAASGLTSSSSAATPATGDFVCSGLNGRAWAQVAGAPNSYITGNCANNWHLHRTYHSDEPNANGGWDGGQVYGDYNGCGVVKSDEDAKVASASYSACAGTVEQDPGSYISTVDCRSGQSGNCSWDTDLHGATDTQVVQTCQAYANTRPFSSSGATGINPVQTIGPGSDFRWRYITHDGRFVLGYQGSAPSQYPQWIFVPVGCVTTPHAVTP